MAKVTMRRKPISESEYLRRRATSAMIDALCQTSPAQAAFRDAGREQEELMQLLMELHAAGEDIGPTTDNLIACGGRLMVFADLIDRQWGR